MVLIGKVLIARSNKRMIIGGIWSAILIVGVMIFLAVSPPTMAVPVVLPSITLPGVFGLVYFLARLSNPDQARQSTAAAEMDTETIKRKRATGSDMYSLIDRMLDELDEDELIYRRRRLNLMDGDEPLASADLATSLEDLLDERREHRQQ